MDKVELRQQDIGLIAIAYTLATFHGESIQKMGVRNYVCRTTPVQSPDRTT